MAIKTQVSAILDKKMDRQDFLKHVAIGLVALSGAGAALKVLGSSQTKQQSSAKSNSYGGSAYGR